MFDFSLKATHVVCAFNAPLNSPVMESLFCYFSSFLKRRRFSSYSFLQLHTCLISSTMTAAEKYIYMTIDSIQKGKNVNIRESFPSSKEIYIKACTRTKNRTNETACSQYKLNVSNRWERQRKWMKEREDIREQRFASFHHLSQFLSIKLIHISRYVWKSFSVFIFMWFFLIEFVVDRLLS